jgi:ribose/xylose/arabinose/galactoside ABC-type transport system permease subunit
MTETRHAARGVRLFSASGLQSGLRFVQARFYLLALVGVLVGFSISSDRFLRGENLLLVLVQASVLLIAAMGETFVILAGSIDLAVGSIIGIGSAATAVLGPQLGMWVFPVAGVVGALCGAFSGLMFAKGRIPSFIATLATMTILRGLVYIITKGISVPITQPSLRIIGVGKTIGIPNALLVTIVLVAIAYYLCHFHRFGHQTSAIGGTERVAALSGINVDRMKIIIFILSGFFAGMSGSVLASRMGAGSPYSGLGQELDVIACVVLGGTAMTGGIGGINGTIIGTLIIAILSNGLNVTGVDPYVQTIVKGFVLWLAVLISMERRKVGIIK